MCQKDRRKNQPKHPSPCSCKALDRSLGTTQQSKTPMRQPNEPAQVWRRLAPSSQCKAVSKMQRRNLPRRRGASSPRGQAPKRMQSGAVPECAASLDAQRRTFAPLRREDQQHAWPCHPGAEAVCPSPASAARAERSRSWIHDVCAASVAEGACPPYRCRARLLPLFVRLPTAEMGNVSLARTRTDKSSLAAAPELWKLRAGCLGFLDVGLVARGSMQACHEAGG